MDVQTTEVAVTQVKFTPLFEKNSLTRADAGHKLIRSRAEPSRAEPSRAEPSRAEPSRAEPSRAEPSRAEPSRAEPSRAEPSRAEPSRARSSCPPGRVMPRLSGYRSGWPSSSLSCAPCGAQSDPLPTDPGAAAPGSVRKIHQIHEILILAERYSRARRIAPSTLSRCGNQSGSWLDRCAAPHGAPPQPPHARPGRLAATVLAVGLLLLGAAAAEAQTPVTLVQNVGQTPDDSANTSGNDHAQLFRTGNHTVGYTLTGMHVSSDDAQGDDFDVEICEEDGTANEFPSAGDCTALTAPASFTAGLLFFDHTGLALSANTNYVVVIKQRGTGSVELDSTTSSGEDSTGLSDWSIKNKFYWKSGSTWMIKSGGNEALSIILYGYANTFAGAPTDLTVTLSHSCHVDLYWSAPSSDGGKAIAKYEQRTRKGNGSFGPWQTDLGNPLAVHVTLGTLACDDYTFQVRAVTANGAGPSASITFTSVDEGPPNEPVELVAVGGFRRVALSWDTPVPIFTRIDYYQVRYRSSEQLYTSWTRIPNSNYRTTSHTLTGLADETPYDIQVRAVNSEGNGASAQRKATTLALPVDAPSGFTATAGIRKVDLAWTAAASTVGVEAYQYRLSTDGGDTWSPEWTDIPGSNSSTTRHTVSRLANRTAYTVELRIRAGTTHSNAASGSATTPDVPSAPVLSATPGDWSITLTWTTPHNGGRAITKYQYRRTRGSPGFTAWFNIRGSGPNTNELHAHRRALGEGGNTPSRCAR